VAVLENSETPFIAENAFKQVPEAIVANQSWEVDVVSGATVTSKAIMAAVEAALTE
ncbi:MAG TPA: FMN-binding protein, partial [Firmicutes bacterium]|nr:FMN-binding protein [Bacillota bacterium]